ncbi:2'-5' RNA ligase family protein [Sphingomonas cavernae]|uniref:2'-5' RNA ligase family protein n=1 Tax=Sphingomonas cavernae TaxID=2320861 RepID=A0A418WNX0_9SPHN|nr:2'-5' RNA ligase family protein [Sphingomonas cavernae]RJF92920.1 2'-5' RNA ligase family protein [Sphingomonas cavernae]
MGAPIIVSALFGDADFAWLDGLRRAHYPAEHNRVPAHLTLFQHLPPAIEPELRDQLSAATRGMPSPAARVTGVMRLDRGVALRVGSPALDEIRAQLAEHFHGLLIVQDQAGWRPHITIQNKVEPSAARALADTLEQAFRPRPLAIAGLAAWRYRGGLWEPLSRHRFG